MGSFNKGFFPLSRNREVRSWIATVCEREPWRRWGLRFYDRAASDSATRFLQVAAVERIWMVGGTVDRCRPGVSDVDFVLFLKDGLSAAQEIKALGELKSHYRILKKRWGVPGEIHLTSPKRWKQWLRVGPSPLLWLSPYREFEGGQWSEARQLPEGIVSPHSRFSLSQAHYYRACHSLVRSRRGPHRSFEKNQFEKEIAKCIALASREPIRLAYEGRPADRVREAFRRLDDLAKELLKTSVMAAPPLSYDGGEKAPSLAPALEVVSHELRDRFNRALGQAEGVLSTEFYFHYLLAAEADEATFSQYVESLAAVPAQAPGFVLVSEAMVEALAKGWAWEKPFQNLASLHARHRDSPSEGKRILEHMARGLWERLVFHGDTLAEFSLYDSAATRNTVLRHFCLESLMLVTETVSADFSILARHGRLWLPRVARLWESLSVGRFPWDESQYLEHVLPLREEVRSALGER